VSAFQKLFLATALLATGLAVAVLLGQPVANNPAAGSTVQRAPQPIILTPPATSAPAASSISSVRLLPDADPPSKPATLLDAPALLAPLAPISSFSNAAFDPPAAQIAAVTSAPPPRSFDSGGPIVHLRNEAPRPIGNEPRSPAAIRRAPPVDGQINSPATNSDPYHVASIWSAAPPTAGNGMNFAGNTPATPTAFANPALVEDDRQTSAPPPPMPMAAEDVDDARTHIVADGDSLEKLAALYLSDPQRSKEIFELNRGILSDPNLLPIGAELKIPERIARTSWDRQSRRPGFQGDSTVREAATGDLVPIRSFSEINPGAVPPRAQLTRPVAAD
jgi:nucleoid-associated protein YgaU